MDFRPLEPAITYNLATLITTVRWIPKSIYYNCSIPEHCAFDNVDPPTLLKDLKEIGVPVHFRKFVENLISIRYLNFVINSKLFTAHI